MAFPLHLEEKVAIPLHIEEEVATPLQTEAAALARELSCISYEEFLIPFKANLLHHKENNSYSKRKPFLLHFGKEWPCHPPTL